MTQQDLADAAGVDLKTVYNLESGTRWPIARTRSAIAAALGWGPDALTVIAADVPQASPERGESGLVRDGLTPRMQALAAPYYDIIEEMVNDAAIDGPDTAGSVIFPDPVEADRWDRVVAIWRAYHPGEPDNMRLLTTRMAVGRVRDAERRAAEQPEHVREK